MSNKAHELNLKDRIITFREYEGPDDKCQHCMIEDRCLALPEISDHCVDTLGGNWRVTDVRRR